MNSIPDNDAISSSETPPEDFQSRRHQRHCEAHPREDQQRGDDEEALSRPPTDLQEDNMVKILSHGSATKYSSFLPEMGGDKPYPPLLSDHLAYRVEFTGANDPLSPLNWTGRRKVILTAALSYVTMNITFASSIYASTTAEMESVFHVGTTPASLGTSLFVLGFALGPCIWGPLSEYNGRKPPLVVASFFLLCFSFASATAKDFQTIVLSRFFGSAGGSAALSIVPGCFTDMYTGQKRGTAVSVFALCVAGGPMLGPVIGDFIVRSYLGWRWCLYISGIMSALSLVVIVFVFEETYHPVLLARKARELRERTGNWGIYAQHETLKLDFVDMLSKSTVRPLRMLVQEAILFLVSLYGGFIYGMLYMCLSALPLMYGTKYGWTSGVIGLPYLSLMIGCAVETAVSIVYFEPRYRRALERTGLPVVPEERLPLMMLSAPMYTISIFWMFWTGAYPKTPEHPHGCHFMVPIVGGSLFGFGFLGIFMSMINYVVDSYLILAASGVAANSFMRSICAAAFPLFATQMFVNLGIQWAGTLVGCLSLAMLPIPFLFYKYGAIIRRKSKFATDLTEAREVKDKEAGNKQN